LKAVIRKSCIKVEKIMHKMQYLLKTLLKLNVKLKYYFQVVLNLTQKILLNKKKKNFTFQVVGKVNITKKLIEI